MSSSIRISSALLSILTITVTLASPLTSLASDADAQAKLTAARELWAKRAPNTPEQPDVEKAVALLKAAEGETQNRNLLFDILVLRARATYWLGTHAESRNDKKTVFERAMKVAENAAFLRDDRAEGYYFYAISLGRWAEANGVDESLDRKPELVEMLQLTMEAETLDGKKGETIDWYGPHRVFGKMYYKLPGFAGGDLNKALKHLRKAVKEAPDDALNYVYLATALTMGDAEQKKEGCRILTELLKNDPATFSPAERLPETIEEFKEGAELKESACR